MIFLSNFCSVTETVFYLENFDLAIIKGITVFKIFIYGGISSDIWLEILFCCDMSAEQ